MIFVLQQIAFIKWGQNYTALGTYEKNYHTNVIKMPSNSKNRQKTKNIERRKTSFPNSR